MSDKNINSEDDKLEQDVLRRADWQRHQQLIEIAFVDYLKTNKRYPTITYLAEKTSLNLLTIHRHLKDNDSFFADIKDMSKALMQSAFGTLAQKALDVNNKNPAWMALFLEATKLYNPKEKPIEGEITVKIKRE